MFCVETMVRMLDHIMSDVLMALLYGVIPCPADNLIPKNRSMYSIYNLNHIDVIYVLRVAEPIVHGTNSHSAIKSDIGHATSALSVCGQASFNASGSPGQSVRDIHLIISPFGSGHLRSSSSATSAAAIPLKHPKESMKQRGEGFKLQVRPYGSHNAKLRNTAELMTQS